MPSSHSGLKLSAGSGMSFITFTFFCGILIPYFYCTLQPFETGSVLAGYLPAQAVYFLEVLSYVDDMARRSRKQDNQEILLFLAVAVLAGYGSIEVLPNLSDSTHSMFLLLLFILFIAGLLFSIYAVYRYTTKKSRARNFAALRAHEIDHMSGKEFEIFLKHLLTARGFTVKDVWHGNDGGVDLVAKIDDKIYSIQAKRYRDKKADRRAITDAVAGITYRNCTDAMAITNSYFTKAAIEYAGKTGCELIDRDILAKWVFELQGSK